MASYFPAFDEPTPIDADRSWTAGFDSYDQRNEDAYYRTTILRDGREIARLMVVISLYSAGDDWRGPEFVELLRRGIHEVAVAGVSNTSYLSITTAPGAGRKELPEPPAGGRTSRCRPDRA